MTKTLAEIKAESGRDLDSSLADATLVPGEGSNFGAFSLSALWSWIKGKCATVVQSGNANPVTSGAVKSELDTNYYNKQSVDTNFATKSDLADYVGKLQYKNQSSYTFTVEDMSYQEIITVRGENMSKYYITILGGQVYYNRIALVGNDPIESISANGRQITVTLKSWGYITSCVPRFD